MKIFCDKSIRLAKYRKICILIESIKKKLNNVGTWYSKSMEFLQ